MRLWLRIYLGFLATLLLALGGTALTFYALYRDDSRSRWQDFSLTRAQEIRDMVEDAMREGVVVEHVADLIMPFLRKSSTSMLVFTPDDVEVIRVEHAPPPPDAPPQPMHPPTPLPALAPGDLAKARASRLLVINPDRTVKIGLPVLFPNGHVGVVVMGMRGPPPFKPWGNWRMLAPELVALIIFGFLACYIIARRLTRPLLQLGEAAELFGAGDFKARARVAGNDELAILGRRFNAMADRIGRMIEDQRRLLGDVSHELKTPLSRLRLSFALARDGANTEALAYLDRGERQVDALAALIDELALVARLEIEPYTPVWKKVHVAEFLRGAVGDEPRVSIEAHDIRCAIDERLLGRALSNLVQNALKYSPEGTTVHVEAKVDVSDEGDVLQLQVTDKGPGVPETEQMRIFKAFYRSESTATKAGTGLGLAIAKRCVDALGGHIAVGSPREGNGLRVAIRVPMRGWE